jgi:hypothetical protein
LVTQRDQRPSPSRKRIRYQAILLDVIQGVIAEDEAVIDDEGDCQREVTPFGEQPSFPGDVSKREKVLTVRAHVTDATEVGIADDRGSTAEEEQERDQVLH